MRKEAINTFGEGLIMDLHPLTTPSNVLTNCLNGTIITYNGNEFVLQNDMGNGEVHTAYLDKGYVPVGMKEHGGIIYVAAHNPITGKSQIGSFPSPQQLYEGEDLNVTPIEFEFSKFITMKGSVPYIELEYYKEKLFQVKNSDEVKIFHPGDRFVIVANTIDAAIKEAINRGAIKLRLGVINSSGSIDYIDEKNLKIYNNGLWIYENSNTPMLDVIKSKELVQVFSAKSSGALILVIELKTFDTFNLIRKYSCNDDTKVISVEFSGETTGVFKGTTKNNPDDVGLIEANSSSVKSTIIKSGKTGKTQYKIMPACPYGVLERMAKSGTIDFDAIRTNSEVLDEWRFFVTDTYLKIGWGYDYYNLNEDSDIEKIEFTFISLTDSAEANNAENLNGAYKYTISKEYYNGSFEEIIPFDDSTIQKNWIYIVRIDRYVAGVKKTVGYKLIYTGGYFNDFYEEIPDFNTGLPNGSNRSKVLLGLKNEVGSSVKPGNIELAIKVNDSNSFVTKAIVNPSDYIKEVPSATSEVNYRYNTRKRGAYEVTIRPSVDYDYNSRLYAGKADQKVISGFFGNSPRATFGTPNNSEVTFSNNSPLSSEITNIESEVGILTYNASKGEFTGTVNTSRNIIASNGPVKSITTDVEKLMPIYRSDMSQQDRGKLFSFSETGDTLYCVTGDEDYCCYNSRILRSNAHTEGSYKGPNGGAGADDDGLRACLASMGEGIIGIFGGHDCDHASLFYGYSKNRGLPYNFGAWYRSKSEVASEDNFLLATWKDRDGIPHVINLGSEKTTKHDLTSTGLIRVDAMLKCFLSQMLVASKSSKVSNFVGPNGSEFVYHNAFNTSCDVNIQVNNAGKDVDVDFFLDGSSISVETHMTRWMAAIKELKNYLPLFKVHMPTVLSTYIEYGDNIRFDNDSVILNCYTSAYSYYSLPTTELTDAQRNKIHVGVRVGTNNDGSLMLATNSDGTYQTMGSDTQLYDWRGGTISLGYSLNSRFINSYALSKMSGKVPDGFFNGIYITDTTNAIGRWTKKKDSHAPDMAYKIGFGSKSIYKYE